MTPLAASACVAILATLAASPAAAQPQPVAPVAAPQATVLPPQNPAPATKGRRWLKADARVCLEFPTDLQVIKCSEKYR
jgi:hypothetical protein